MTVYIAPIQVGLGDLVVTLPVIQALIDSGEPTKLVAWTPEQLAFAPLIKGLSGACLYRDFKTVHLEKDERLITLRKHPLQTEYRWGSSRFRERYGDIRIGDILAIICRDLGIPANFSQPKALIYQRRPELASYIILVPGSAMSYKEWPVDRWKRLAELISASGLPFAIVGEPKNSQSVARLIDIGFKWIATPSIADAVDVLSSARCVVSVDTGLMHVAAQQSTPTVALFNSYGLFAPAYDHVSILTGLACPQSCAVDWNDDILVSAIDPTEQPIKALQCKSNDDEKCLNTISVESVVQAVYKALAQPTSACRFGNV